MRHLFYYISRFLLWVFFRLGFALEVSGQEHVPKKGAFIVASNHVSYLDPPVVGVACPRRLRFMARSSLFRHMPLGAFLKAVNVIPLHRGEADISAIRKALYCLNHGEAVAIFPEGTRQLSGNLGEAKRGVGLLALKAKVPIIPVLVKGTFEAFSARKSRWYRAKIRVAFGPAIAYNIHSRPEAKTPTKGQTGVISIHDRAGQLAKEITQRWHLLLKETILE